MTGGNIQCWLLLLLPTLLLAQDDCSHNCKSEANRYYYVRPEGPAETLCPAQPCLTPSQLREHFSECERNNSCQTANTSLVLLPGSYTSASNHGSIIPPIEFLSLTGLNEECNSDSLITPSIDCNGSWISLMFQHINCVNVINCVVFTGNDTDVEMDHVIFHDSLIRLASITAADRSELDYKYTLGSQSYCVLQKQLADINALTSSHSVLALRNVTFSSDYHSTCAREYGIQLATIHATDSALDIADCLFTQNAITHISLLRSTLHTSGMVRFENANTAIIVKSSTVVLAGAVGFFNNYNSAIHALDTHSTVLLEGTVDFTNNNADKGGAVFLESGNLTIADNAQVVFRGNHADTAGGAIYSFQHVTIAGAVQFINNSAAYWGGAIVSDGTVTIADNAQVVFECNRADNAGGAMVINSDLLQLAGRVQLIDNTAVIGGAIAMFPGYMAVASNAMVVFQGNHAYHVGGAIYSSARTLVHYALKTEPCSISFGINSYVDLLHNTAERGGSAMYGITMSKLQCNLFSEGDYTYLFDVITIIPDSFSVVSSDPLRVCICPDQSTPDCLAILPDQNIPHLHYTVYPGQNFTIPAAVVGFNFALTSGSVYAQFLTTDVLGSDTQYVQGVNQNGCTQLQYSVLSGKKQVTLVLTTDGRRVGDIDSSVKEDITLQSNNSVSLYNKFKFSNPNKYYVNNTFMTNLTDSVFHLAGAVQIPLQSTPVYVSVQLLDCPPGFTLTDQQRCDCNDRILTNLLTCNINNQTVRRYGNIWINASFSGNASNGVIVHPELSFWLLQARSS